MEATLDQPAGKAVEAVPDDVADALSRLSRLSGDSDPLIVCESRYFRSGARASEWSASAQLNGHPFSASFAPNAREAVNLWVAELMARKQAAMESVAALERLAREPYDARSPNAEERERAEFDENNVGERHDGGPL